MVAIDVNTSDQGDLPAWRDKGKYTFPILLPGESDFAEKTYGVFGTPTNLILGTDGKLVFRHLGYGTGNEITMEAEIRDLLGLDPFAGSKPAQTKTDSKK